MIWNEMEEMSVEKWWNEICGRGKREKPREKPTQTPFRPARNPHGGFIFIIVITAIIIIIIITIIIIIIIIIVK